jgi:hypothetical protein
VQEQVGWRDRVFVTGALRSDDHSAFGASFNRVVYPKFSLSYVLSDEPWFKIPYLSSNLDQFRLRLGVRTIGQGAEHVFVDQDVHADVGSDGHRRRHAEHDR